MKTRGFQYDHGYVPKHNKRTRGERMRGLSNREALIRLVCDDTMPGIQTETAHSHSASKTTLWSGNDIKVVRDRRSRPSALLGSSASTSRSETTLPAPLLQTVGICRGTHAEDEVKTEVEAESLVRTLVRSLLSPRKPVDWRYEYVLPKRTFALILVRDCESSVTG